MKSLTGNVIFLDIDGVISTSDDYLDNGGFPAINQDLTNKLAKLVKAVDGQIVLSSNWRFEDNLVAMFKDAITKAGISDCFVGKTPWIGDRAQEVKQIIDSSPKLANWLVIDDDKVDVDNFLQCNSQVGLTDQDIDKAIRHFKR